MKIGQKIRKPRESKGMFQRQMEAKLEIKDGFLSKIEHDQKALKREHLKFISKIFKHPLKKLEPLFVTTKIYD